MAQEKSGCEGCGKPAVHVCTTHATLVCGSLHCSCCPSGPALLTGPKTERSVRPVARGLPETNITLSIEQPGGATLLIPIKKNATIGALKRLIEDRTGIAPADQQLQRGVTVLTNDLHKLYDYKLADGDKIVLQSRTATSPATTAHLLHPPAQAAATLDSDNEWMMPTFQALARIAAFRKWRTSAPYEELTSAIVSALHEAPDTPPGERPSPLTLPGTIDAQLQWLARTDVGAFLKSTPAHLVYWLAEKFDDAYLDTLDTDKSMHPWTSLFQWKQTKITWTPGMTDTYKRETLPIFVLEPYLIDIPIDHSSDTVSMNDMILRTGCFVDTSDIGPSVNAAPGYQVPARLRAFFKAQRIADFERITRAMDAVDTQRPPHPDDIAALESLGDILVALGFASRSIRDSTTTERIRNIRDELRKMETRGITYENAMREVISDTVARLVPAVKCMAVVDPPEILIISLSTEDTTRPPEDPLFVRINLDEEVVLPKGEVWIPDDEATAAAAAAPPRYRLFAIINGNPPDDAFIYTIDSANQWYNINGERVSLLPTFKPNLHGMVIDPEFPAMLWYARLR